MAGLTKVDINHVASLSKLKLGKGEIEKFESQLGQIVEYFQKLSKVGNDDISNGGYEITNVLRDDVVDPTQSLSQQEALSGTDKNHNGFFVVDALISADEITE